MILCRDVYHCTPVELRRVPLAKIMEHIACLAGESRYFEDERKKREQELKRG